MQIHLIVVDWTQSWFWVNISSQMAITYVPNFAMDRLWNRSSKIVIDTTVSYILEQEIDGVALCLEGLLLQNHLQPVVADLVASYSIFCDLQLVVDAFFFFVPSLARPEDCFTEKMVQITSFAWKAEGSGVSVLCVEVFLLVCNVFYRWLLTDKPTAVLPYYITVTVWPEIFVSKPRIVLLPAALIFQVPLCPLSKWLLWSCYGDGGFCLCCCVYYSWLFRFGFFLRVYSAPFSYKIA